MKDLLGWLKRTDAHPLIASCVFHYELEFIHPFADGNGRMGRLWQTLILSRWNPLIAYLPVESVIRDRQQDYYTVLGICDKLGNSTAFIEFLLDALLFALRELAEKTFESGAQSEAQSGAQSEQILKLLVNEPFSANELAKRLGLESKTGAFKRSIKELIDRKNIEYTIPEKPNSRLQKYRLTDKGKSVL
jgi:Fic family protein